MIDRAPYLALRARVTVINISFNLSKNFVYIQKTRKQRIELICATEIKTSNFCQQSKSSVRSRVRRSIS